MILSARNPAAHSWESWVWMVPGDDGVIGGDDDPAGRVVDTGERLEGDEPLPVVARVQPGRGMVPARTPPAPRTGTRPGARKPMLPSTSA